MRNRLPITIAGALLVVAGLAPGHASAHNGGVTAGCHDGAPRVVVSLSNYNGTNTISVKVDGGPELTSGTFGSSYSNTFPIADPYTAHQVVYKVTAHDDPSNAHGWSPGGTLTVPACQTPTTTTVAPTTTSSTTTTSTSTTSVEPTTTVAPTTTDRTTRPTEPQRPTTTMVGDTVPSLPATGTRTTALTGLAVILVVLGALVMVTRRQV